MKKMKAIVFSKKGKVNQLQVKEVDKPTPKDNEVLIRIHATTLNSGDCARIALGLLRSNKTITGSELAGDVEEIGQKVKLFNKGDKVFGYKNTGAHAEYVCLHENATLLLKPPKMTYEEAAAVPNGALAALYFLKKGKIRNGQKVLINGASGSVGTFAIQLAKHFGAEVTGVCSTTHIEMVKKIGADSVIDYTTDDFTKSKNTYDMIFDTVGNTSLKQCKKILSEKGSYVSTALSLSLLIDVVWATISGRQRVVIGIAKQTQEGLNYLKDLIEAEKVASVIDDKSSNLFHINEVYANLNKGSKKGNLVLTL